MLRTHKNCQRVVVFISRTTHDFPATSLQNKHGRSFNCFALVVHDNDVHADAVRVQLRVLVVVDVLNARKVIRNRLPYITVNVLKLEISKYAL